MDARTYSILRYSKILAYVQEEINQLAKVKGGEYAGDSDRLANFRRNAERLGLPMESVWAVYAAKHWDAIIQYIQDKNTGKTRPRSERITGRAMDMIVYLTLFLAMEDENSPIKELDTLDKS